MMNTKILMSGLFCSFFLSGFAQANDKVESSYIASVYQKVCKGQTQGQTVSFPYKGIIWNGTCELQFFPISSKGITGNEPELATSCASDASIKSTSINGSEVKGKCALGFMPPMPK